MNITKQYLINNPNHIFVFGDNTIRKGKAGAAALRDMPNSYGFITKKYPNNKDESFYRLDEYRSIFLKELQKLELNIRQSKGVVWLISPVGSGLANKYKIWENIIKPEFERFSERYQNVRLLW